MQCSYLSSQLSSIQLVFLNSLGSSILFFGIYNLKIKKMITIMQVMVMIALICTMTCQQCKPDKNINDFYSGSATFSMPIIENNTLLFSYSTYNITLAKPYTKTTNLQYAFAIKDMTIKTSNLQCFDLLVLKTYQSSLILNFIYEPNKWTVITYNYWISFKEDIMMGIQTYSMSHIKKIDDQYAISHIIKKKFTQNQNKYVTLIYLNGLRFDNDHPNSQSNSSNSSVYKVHYALKSQKLMDNTLHIHFQCSKNLLLKYISFSYVIYMPQALDYVSYGGTITYQDFKGKSKTNLKYILPDQYFYSLYGISALSTLKSVKQEGFSLSSQLTTTFSFNFGINEWQKLPIAEITYMIIGKMPAELCRNNLKCKQDERIYLYGDYCVDQCPINDKIIKYIDGSYQCRKCPASTSYNSTTNKCVCGQGQVLQQGNLTCVKVEIPVAQPTLSIVLPVQTAPATVQAAVKTTTQPALTDPSAPTVLVSEPTIINSLSTISVDTNLGQTAKMESCFTLLKMQNNNKNIFLSIQATPVLKQPLSNLKSYQFKLLFSEKKTKPKNYYCAVDAVIPYKYNCLLLYNQGLPPSQFPILIQIKNVLCESTFHYPLNIQQS